MLLRNQLLETIAGFLKMLKFMFRNYEKQNYFRKQSTSKTPTHTLRSQNMSKSSEDSLERERYSKTTPWSNRFVILMPKKKPFFSQDQRDDRSKLRMGSHVDGSCCTSAVGRMKTTDSCGASGKTSTLFSLKFWPFCSIFLIF